MHGSPVRVPSPCMERNISEMIMIPLPVPARGLFALPPLHENHCAHNQYSRGRKTEWIQSDSKPVKCQQVSQAHGKGRNHHDEE